MKKTVALFLTFAVLLSLCGAAFAENEIYQSFEVSGEGTKRMISEDVYAAKNTRYALYAHDGGEINAEGSAYSSNSVGATVIASGEGSVVTVGENAEYRAERGTAVSADDGGTVTVRKEIRANGDGSCGISADNGTVTALGNVTARGYESEAIEATNGGTVTVGGDISAEGYNSRGVSANAGTVTANGNVTVDGDHTKVVEAINGSTVSVTGDISATLDSLFYMPREHFNNDFEYYNTSYNAVVLAVDVQNGSTVSVEGDISAYGRGVIGVKAYAGTANVTGNVEVFDSPQDIRGMTPYEDSALYAEEGAHITVKGDVSSTYSNGISALRGCTVTVDGNVIALNPTERNECDIWAATGNGDCDIYITGNLITEGLENTGAYAVDKSKVTVGGNVTAGEECYAAVYAESDAEANVGGDVKGDVEAWFSSTVIVEGNAKGEIYSDEKSKIYLGGNDGAEVTEGKDRVYFLIGGVDSGNWENVSVSGSFALGGNGGEKITGVARDASGKAVLPDAEDTSGTKSYYSSVSMQDLEALCASSEAIEVVLSAAGSKVTGVSGFGAGVTGVPYGDAYKLVIDPAAASIHLSDLLVTLEQIVRVYPELSADISFTSETGSAGYAAAVVEVAVVNTEEINPNPVSGEPGVSPCRFNGHGGITVTAEKLGSAGSSGIKVFHDGQQLRSDDYTLYKHSDGSVSLIISNTYLMKLGRGTYTFTAEINGTLINFVLYVDY